jgi:hypothetical protein
VTLPRIHVLGLAIRGKFLFSKLLAGTCKPPAVQIEAGTAEDKDSAAEGTRFAEEDTLAVADWSGSVAFHSAWQRVGCIVPPVLDMLSLEVQSLTDIQPVICHILLS